MQNLLKQPPSLVCLAFESCNTAICLVHKVLLIDVF